MKRGGPGRNDAELLLVVLFWAFNVSVVKLALREMEPLAFNIVRFAAAAAALLALTRWLEGPIRIERRDRMRLLALGVAGHTLYQLCFVLGLARTTASSTALIFGSTPIVVAILSWAAGHERIGAPGAAGALLAFYGIWLIVGGASGGGDATGATASGNLLIVLAVLCWSAYTVYSSRLLARYSPLRVTAVTLTIGAVLLAPVSLPSLVRQDWARVSPLTWAGLAYSFIFALVISYVIWYRSVKEVGNLRTAIYSNLVPVFGTLCGVWILGERLTTGIGLGGACILAGIVLTRRKGASVAVSTDTAP